MVNPYEMNAGQFKAVLADRTTPDEVFNNARRIYDYLSEVFRVNSADSVIREWTFEWWAAETNRDYGIIYDEWLLG